MFKKDVIVSHIPIPIVKSIILPMEKLKQHKTHQFFCYHSVKRDMYAILKPSIKGENVGDSLSDCLGVLVEGYKEPWDREGSVVATGGVVNDITINHQQFTYVHDRTLRNFSFQRDINKSMGINFYHRKNSCHHVCGTPRKCSSSVLVSNYHCEEWDITLLICVLNDMN